jgi:hypothetical protein
MVELDASTSAQIALSQQRATIGFIKQQADAEKQIADVLLTTITASNKGQKADLYA